MQSNGPCPQVLGWIRVEPAVSSMARAESASERVGNKDREVAVSMFGLDPQNHCTVEEEQVTMLLWQTDARPHTP